LDIARFPRVRLGRQSTPLESMENLSRVLGGPRLWIKRDECTGLSTGGKKTRKLEFLMAEAVARKADVVITYGATQSKRARQSAAAAARLGMRCHIPLEDRTGSTDPSYTGNGNAPLDHVHGVAIERHSGGSDMQAESLRDQWNWLMTRDNPPTTTEKDDFRRRHQSSTVLSQPTS